jgi:hypothetical protein
MRGAKLASAVARRAGGAAASAPVAVIPAPVSHLAGAVPASANVRRFCAPGDGNITPLPPARPPSHQQV